MVNCIKVLLAHEHCFLRFHQLPRYPLPHFGEQGKVLSEPFIAGKQIRESYGPWQMGAGQYFMMGDNRNDSEDSRDHGPVIDKDIHGRATFQLWPMSGFGKLQ